MRNLIFFVAIILPLSIFGQSNELAISTGMVVHGDTYTPKHPEYYPMSYDMNVVANAKFALRYGKVYKSGISRGVQAQYNNVQYRYNGKFKALAAPCYSGGLYIQYVVTKRKISPVFGISAHYITTGKTDVRFVEKLQGISAYANAGIAYKLNKTFTVSANVEYGKVMFISYGKIYANAFGSNLCVTARL